MFGSREVRPLPFYALGLILLNLLWGLPPESMDVVEFLEQTPFGWFNFMVISTLAIYNLSQTFGQGGRFMREAYLSTNYEQGITHVIRHTWLLILGAWLLLIVGGLVNIYREQGSILQTDVWVLYQAFAYELVRTIAYVHLVASIGLFAGFLNAWFLVQLASLVSTTGFRLDKIGNAFEINLEWNWPFPLYGLPFKTASQYSVLLPVEIILSIALFFYAYKLWRDKQWYLRKA